MKPTNDMREQKRCTVCGENTHITLYSWEPNFYDHEKFETCSWDGRQSLSLTIVQCTNCAHVYTSPAFRPVDLGLVYPADIVPDDTDSVWKNLTAKKYVEFAHTVAKFFPRGSVVCDVGTRYGGLPKQLINFEMQAFGLEYNTMAVERALQFANPVAQGTVDDIESAAKSFGYSQIDVVTMDDVSEHLAYPDKDFRHIFNTLRSGGGLVTRQMNIDSVGHKLYRRDWYYLQPAAHMNYFSPSTLGRLLETIGFKVIAVEKPAKIAMLYRLFVQRHLSKVRRRILSRSSTESEQALRKLQGQQTTAKPLYLRERKKSPNDMFTIVCVKP